MEKRSVIQEPKNPVATFVDEYGDLKVIHRKKGRRLSVFTGGDTPALRMNRAAVIIIGQKVRAMRLKKGLSQKTLSVKAGLQNVNPKQYIHAIEAATREAGVRMGTLYALSFALDCEVSDLLPSVNEVLEYAGMTANKMEVLS